MRRQQLKRAVKIVFTGQLVEETGWRAIEMWQHPQTTSNSCRWQLPYSCSHDSPRKWNKSRWLI